MGGQLITIITWCNLLDLSDLLTFNEININIVVIPSSESPRAALPIFLKMLAQVSMNSLPLPGSPSSDLTWLLEIVRAAAVVNPTITGIETKSTRKPGGRSKGYWCFLGVEFHFLSDPS